MRPFKAQIFGETPRDPLLRPWVCKMRSMREGEAQLRDCLEAEERIGFGGHHKLGNKSVDTPSSANYLAV